jgi:hypothetical protein
MTTRKQVERFIQAHHLDFIATNRVMRMGGLSKCGMLRRVVDANQLNYPDLIELLTVEELEKRFHNDSAMNTMLSGFTPMYTDFYVIMTAQQYRSGQSSNNANNYVTVGFGLYYARVSYTIDEDDDYFYISCSFDLYIDRRCMIPRVASAGQDDSVLLISPTIAQETSPNAPTYVEVDAQLEALSERLGHQTNRNQPYGYNQRNRQIYNTSEGREAYRTFLQRDRYPQMRRTAMGEQDAGANKIRIPNALHTCVAISKSMKLKANKDQPSTIINVPSPWLYSSRVTCSLREGRIMGYNSKIDYAVQSVSNSVANKRHELRFTGLIGKGDVYVIANVITTNESPGDLKSLLMRKIKPKNYPKTKSKRLLSMNAILETYTEEKVDGIEILDISNVLPDHSDLTLVRVGDGDLGRTGDTLDKYCAIEDGVFKINITRASMLRKDKRKVKINPGEYVVCVISDDTDLIKYNNLVSSELRNIQVESIISRLSLGSSSKKNIRATQSRRGLRHTALQEPAKMRKKKIRVKRTRNPFAYGKSKIKKEEKDEDEDGFEGLGSLFG